MNPGNNVHPERSISLTPEVEEFDSLSAAILPSSISRSRRSEIRSGNTMRAFRSNVSLELEVFKN